MSKSMFGSPLIKETNDTDHLMCQYPGCVDRWSVSIGKGNFCSFHMWNKPGNNQWLEQRESRKANFNKARTVSNFLPKNFVEVEI